MVYTASELLVLLTWVMGLGVSAALRQVDSVELGQLVAGVCCSEVHFRWTVSKQYTNTRKNLF